MTINFAIAIINDIIDIKKGNQMWYQIFKCQGQNNAIETKLES